MKIKQYSLFSLVVVGALVSCKPKYEAPVYSKGDINPTRFVMIGGSTTSGYMNDGLYREGQENSVAAIIATQLKLVGGGDFYQPLVSENSVGISGAGLAPLKLGYSTDCLGVTSLSPVRIAAAGDASIFSQNVYDATKPFGNFSLPGLTLNTIDLSGFASLNPFYARMASPTAANVLEDAKNSDPTFFALSLGIEDVLNYAKAGGYNVQLPSETTFQAAYENVITNMTENGAKGVVSTIPDVKDMPFFTTIPWNGLTLDQENADLLNTIFNQIGYSFQVGTNPFMIVDTAANSFAIRQIVEGERLLLSIPLDSVKCNKLGVLFPFRDELVLDATEINYMQGKINAFNEIIRSLANAYGLAVVDINAYSSKLNSSFTYNGATMNALFVSGGTYSLDGINFNARGNALLANEYIKAINKKYNATIPQVDAATYNAIFFP